MMGPVNLTACFTIRLLLCFELFLGLLLYFYFFFTVLSRLSVSCNLPSFLCPFSTKGNSLFSVFLSFLLSLPTATTHVVILGFTKLLLKIKCVLHGMSNKVLHKQTPTSSLDLTSATSLMREPHRNTSQAPGFFHTLLPLQLSLPPQALQQTLQTGVTLELRRSNRMRGPAA